MGKPCGGWYEYFDNGEPKKISLFDFNKEVSFGVNYASDGGIQLKSMSGFVVSSVFYSFDAKVDSLVPMDYAINSDRKFSNISDLYITVANAKDTRLSVLVKINERKYRVDSVKSSVLKIDNAFSRNCKYDIFIESHLYDSNNNEINGINIKDSIIKIN